MKSFIRIVFAVGAFALMVIAAGLMLYAFYGAIRDGFGGGRSVDDILLDTVGYLIVAIALFDVAKYFFEEEVPAEREKRTPADARRGLTKFVSTIIVAVFLEALVLIFKLVRDDVGQLIYPALLVGVACATMISLGIFQRLSATVEREVGAKDRAAELNET
ncbi:GNAT family acetyltransferase [Starkeya sp. ORNL1]|uniref:GNAT family acetyltransferase n=1 Tax=Starkeya sp. ORNL1 TaxID=2709380 RepID=UPI0014631822|nr:GNAT family acetyltransferase [Starkeya sp. ORNL1]QJP12600.1 GNAT family acetyltransferase [Starkeya sp. ORNL1]